MSALVSDEELPAVFSGVEDFEITPEGIEVAQATFNEEALYQAIVQMAMDWFRNQGRPARILDLCSATGLCSVRVSKVIPTERIVLVDIDARALDVGMRSHFANNTTAVPVCADAVTYQDGWSYDLILMNSAYHHIENEYKVEFLRNAARQLARGGTILVGDHFLPPYGNRREFRRSVTIFYEQLVAALKACREPSSAIDVIRRAGLYCWQGDYEFKVAWSVFLDNCREARTLPETPILIWAPHAPLDGSFVGSAAVRLIGSELKSPGSSVSHADVHAQLV